MKTISGKRMCQILESKGWSLARITGSHHIYIKEGENLRITAPIHKNQDLKQGLQRAIMWLSGIDDHELWDEVPLLIQSKSRSPRQWRLGSIEKALIYNHQLAGLAHPQASLTGFVCRR